MIVERTSLGVPVTVRLNPPFPNLERGSLFPLCGEGGVARIARRGCHNPLRVDFLRPRDQNGRSAVLERSAGIARLVLEPEMFQSQFFCQAWHRENRRPAREV